MPNYIRRLGSVRKCNLQNQQADRFVQDLSDVKSLYSRFSRTMITFGSVSPVNMQRMFRAKKNTCFKIFVHAIVAQCTTVVADRQVACRTMSELSELKIRYRDLLARGPSDKELANRDLEIVRLNAALADRDQEIVSLNAALVARDREIERQTTCISGRHARVRLWLACPLKDMCASVNMSPCY
jgi:hypothetical protein